MKIKRLSLLLPLFFPLLAGCSNSDNSSSYDPFFIGDNLDVISDTEAKLVSNEAYDNLMYASSLRQSSTTDSDTTKFYTGAFAEYGTHTSTKSDSESVYYANKIDTNRNIITTRYMGNDTAVEDRNTSITNWYGIRPVKEGEQELENYSLMSKTIEKYNGISSTRYSAEDNFGTKDSVSALWNTYVVKSISDRYLQNDISYSDEYTYVRDNQHIVGYYLQNIVTTEQSKIAPGKEDASYVKKTEEAFVIDFYNDEVNGIGWTVKSVSYRQIISYLTTIDGKESDPIEISRDVDVISLYYDVTREKSEDLPQFELKDSIKFSISKFEINEEEWSTKYVGKYELEDNNDFYRHIEDSFSGHAYYKEIKLEVGVYSFFDGEPTEPEDYKKWGFEDIITNKCSTYITPTYDAYPHVDGSKLFYVAHEATFAFRVVFDADMSKASEFSVAIVGR